MAGQMTSSRTFGVTVNNTTKAKKNTISFYDSTLSSLFLCWYREGLAGIRCCFLSHFISWSVLNTVQYLNTLELTFNSEVRKPHVSKDHLIICSTYIVGLKIIHTLMIHFVAMVMSGSRKAVQIKNKQIKGNSYVSYNLINVLKKTCWLLDLVQYVYS